MTPRLLRLASIDMIKIRRQEHARVETASRRIEQEIGEQTQALRKAIPTVSAAQKENMLFSLRSKMELLKANKEQMAELDREITGRNSTENKDCRC
jgi:ERCC4-type nuclease